eukprot:931872-Rhodomonas_salina.2
MTSGWQRWQVESETAAQGTPAATIELDSDSRQRKNETENGDSTDEGNRGDESTKCVGCLPSLVAESTYISTGQQA